MALSDPSGTLANIDATTQERCACGCGVALRPNGPSAWWANEGCQERWQASHAEPQRETLADRVDQMRAALLGYIDSYRTDARGPVPQQAEPETLALTNNAMAASTGPARLAYKRKCAGCNQLQVPVFGVAQVRVDSWLTDDDEPAAVFRNNTQTGHVCSGCCQPFPAPAMWGRVYKDEHRRWYGFSLAYEHEGQLRRYGMKVSLQMVEYEGIAAHTWRELEHEIAEQLRDPCCVPGCERKYRSTFVVRTDTFFPVSICGRQRTDGEQLLVCAQHAAALYRGTDPAIGQPIERLEPPRLDLPLYQRAERIYTLRVRRLDDFTLGNLFP